MTRKLNTVTITFALAAAVFVLFHGTGAAEDATIPGAVTTPYPTVINLAVEWKIEGDDNLNGRVAVRFRKTGADKWREAMPLFRVPARKDGRFAWANKHSGSIFDLVPGTEYEIELTLTDPDGGSAKKTVKARTRPVPRAPKGAPKRNVTPATIDSVKPGEIGILAPGNYGEFVAKQDGLPGKPIVYRSPDGKAVFETVSLRGRKHIYLEGLTINVTKEGRWSKGVQLLGAESCAVKRCAITTTRSGITAPRAPGAVKCYLADNTITGPTRWIKGAHGSSGKNKGEGIQITGPGTVICFNRVTGFRDCISTMEDASVVDQICIDIYNNDVSVGADDGIETDFCYNNCRVLRNRLTNCAVGLSSQPGLGGPNYFIRNAMYNIYHASFKLKRGSRGDVVLHNTVIKVGTGMSGEPTDFAFFRNNLCIGGPTGDFKLTRYGCGAPAGARVATRGAHNSFDYDAVGTFQVPFRARIGQHDFKTAEPHGIQVDMGVFNDVKFPLPAITEYKVPDLRPKAGSKVVDKGLRLPNINDDFKGRAPDIGAYEAGQELPIYGPRPDGVDEETMAKKRKAAK